MKDHELTDWAEGDMVLNPDSTTALHGQAAADYGHAIVVDASELAPIPDSGKWRVYTESSSYVFDMDARTATRIPGAGFGAIDDVMHVQETPNVSTLRRDYQPFIVHEILAFQVGEPVVMYIEVEAGVVTARTTTVVRAIEKVTFD